MNDFRNKRAMLPAEVFLLPDGQKEFPQPKNMVAKKTWDGIMHLPDHVALYASGHHGDDLACLYGLRGDWFEAIGSNKDELSSAMLDAADCFQASIFDSLHGFYRSALSNLRAIFDIMTAGALGNISPGDEVYLRWKRGHPGASLNFQNCRKRLSKACDNPKYKKLFRQSQWMDAFYEELCSFVHARPDSTDLFFWESNGPIYVERGFECARVFQLTTYAASYLIAKAARPKLSIPSGSEFLFEGADLYDRNAIVSDYRALFE